MVTMTPQERADQLLKESLDSLEITRRGYVTHHRHLVTMIVLFGEEETVTFSLDSYQVNVFIPRVSDIQAELKRLHPIMRKAGYKQGTFVKEHLAWHWDNGKEYADPEYAEVVIYLHLAAGGKCRKVQVGTKEVDVYEIQCDGVAVEEPELETIGGA